MIRSQWRTPCSASSRCAEDGQTRITHAHTHGFEPNQRLNININMMFARALALADSKRKKKSFCSVSVVHLGPDETSSPRRLEPSENCAAPQSNASEPGKFITISGCALPSVPHSPPSSVSVRRRRGTQEGCHMTGTRKGPRERACTLFLIID